MNYRCADLLNNHKPPDRSVRMTNQSSKCNHLFYQFFSNSHVSADTE